MIEGIYLIILEIGVLCAACFLLYKVKKTIKWWKREQPSRILRFFTILLPCLFTLFWVPPMVGTFLDHLPVPEEELSSVSAPVDTVHQYEHRNHSRYSVYFTYTYNLSIKDHKGVLRIPKKIPFDQEDFLNWAGEETLTFRYATVANKSTVYEIEQPDKGCYMTYADSAALLKEDAWGNFLLRLSVFLVATGALCVTPAWLTINSIKERKYRRIALLCWIVGGMCYIFILNYSSNTTVMDTPAYTALELHLDDEIQMDLPIGWKKEENTGEIEWYQVVPGISNRFILEEHSNIGFEASDEEWNQCMVDSRRKFLLDTFIDTSWTQRTPFLTNMETWEGENGVTFLFSQGWGESCDNTKEHMLLILLSEQRKILLIQTSAPKGISWEKLEEHVEQRVFPLLEHIVIND